MRAGWALAVIPLAACSVLTSLDDLKGSPADSGPDVALDVAPVDAGTDAPPDVAAEAAFDAGSLSRLELWVSADDITLDDAGAVSSWRDKSPNNHDVNYALASYGSRCQFPPKMGVMNNKAMPGVFFDGNTQCLGVSTGFDNFTNGLTAFVVMQPANGNSSFLGNTGAVLEVSGANNFIAVRRNPTPAQTASGDGMLSIDNNGSTGSVSIMGGGSWVPAQEALLDFRLPAAPGGTLVAGTAYFDGTAASIGENDPLSPEVQTRNMNGLGFSQTGGSYSLYCGLIGEILLYSRALSDADRVSVETYLKTKWGL